MEQISVRELKAYLDSGKEAPLLLDVREPWEYQICHLDGAELVPMRYIPQNLTKLDPEREIIVICHHGIRSRQVALFLEHQGFSKVINLQGGLDAWAKDVDPNMPIY